MDSENVLSVNEAKKTEDIISPGINILENKLAKIEASLFTENMNQPQKNLVKRLWRKRHRVQSERTTKRMRNDCRRLKTENSKNCLCVSNWPTHWSEDDINDFLSKQKISYKSLEILLSKEIEGRKSLLLLFDSVECAKTAHKAFIDAEIQDTTLWICCGEEALCRDYHSNLLTSDSEGEEDESRLSDSEDGNIRDPLDIWDEDSEGLYGLNRECLRKLEITPPLTNWVHVSNFICDRPTLKELMDVAGSVVVCNVNRNKHVHAKVMYSHPIEAAQAVSMFHSQLYHGKYLNVCIDPGPHYNSHYLPNGITRLGPGFGKLGQPLRDVVKHYERHAAGKKNSLTDYIFGNDDRPIPKFVVKEGKDVTRDDDKIFQEVNELSAIGATQGEIVNALRELKKRMSSGVGDKTAIAPIPKSKFEPKIEKIVNHGKTNSGHSDADSSDEEKGVYSPGKADSPESPRTRDKRLQYPKKRIEDTKPTNYMVERRISNGPVSSNKYPPAPVPAPIGNPMMGPRPCGPNMPMMAANMAPQGPGMMHNPQAGGMPPGCANMPMMGNMVGPNGPHMMQNQFRPGFAGMPGGGFQPAGAGGGFQPAGAGGGFQPAGVWGPPQPGPGPGPGPAGPVAQEMPTSSSVVMYNIPASITAEVLRDKMSVCGRVQYINTQQPGAALIKYATGWEALNCVKTFNKTTVNGSTIEAKLFN